MNLKHVHLYPADVYFPAGGGSVMHVAAPGSVTLARLACRQGPYWLAIVPGEFVEFPPEVAEAKSAATTPVWPHTFARLRVPPDTFLSEYDSNHIHGVYGDYVEDLIWAAKMLGIDYRVLA